MDGQKMMERILGGLYGQALGDAWAMPALPSPEENRQRYPDWFDDFYPAPPDHPVHAGLKAGQVTDDTEQAMALAQAIIEDGRVTAEGAARAILAWYDGVGGDDCPYVGPSTRRSVQALKRGEDLQHAGRFGDTNGAAMRISPVGLIHPGDLEEAVHDAYQACIPTHNTETAISGAAAVAGAIAIAMQPGATLEVILTAGIRAAEMGRALGPRWMGASIAKRIRIAAEIARSSGTEHQRLHEIYDVIGATLAMTEAVPAAFGILVMAGGDPKQSAIYAAAMAGDADTIGAMACAICGAWKGSSAFPDPLTLRLRQANPSLNFEAAAAGLYSLIQARSI
jgi:ADP-ribosylglycohydrolase